VLEHLSQPLAVIKRCRDALKEGGMLVFRVPNIDFVARANRLLAFETSLKRIGISFSSLVNPLSRKEYLFELLGVPYHIFGYNRKTLSDLMRKAGFHDFDIALDGRISTGRRLRDAIEKMLYATAKAIYWLSFKRIIFYYDISVYAIKRS
ncbi:MAG: hypothetical protein P8123_04715, partial [bacterium]